MPSPKPRRREILLSVLATLVVGLGGVLGILGPLERPVADIMIRLPSPRSPGPGTFVAVLIDDRTVDRFGPLPWPRERLAVLIESIRNLGARGVSVDILLSEPGSELGDSRLAKAFAAGPTILAATMDSDGSWILPIERFGGIQNAAHVNAEIEGDGVIRTLSFTKQSQGVSLEAISIAAARRAGWHGVSRPGLAFRPDFLEKPAEIPAVSAIDLFDKRPGKINFGGKVVFLGVSATGSTDQFITPVSRWHRPTPGVLVHAAAASSLLRGGLLSPLNTWAAGIMAFLAALSIQGLRSISGRLVGTHLIMITLILVSGSLAALWTVRVIVPLISLVLATVLSAVFREVVESRDIQTETANILRSLVQEDHMKAPQAPRGPQERLRLAQSLQGRVINDRNLRRTLLEGLAEGVILWDEKGQPLMSNKSMGRLWGEIPTLPEMLQTSGGSADGEQIPEVFERRNQWLEVLFQDLGDRHLAVVRDRSAEKKLDQRRREMQRLVSHELKTPLASLAGFGSLLERYTLTDEELKKTAGLIRGEAERLGEMVRTFLDLERLGAGHWNEERGPVDLEALIEERCTILSAFSSKKNIALEVKTDGPAMISGVRQLLDRVIDNLVGNAIKYAPSGTKVVIRVSSIPRETVLTITDSGPGIPPEAIPHLFERFYRVPGSGAEGSGLGLALVREVLENHQATVAVESTVGEGTAFIVRFPSHSAAEDLS